MSGTIPNQFKAKHEPGDDEDGGEEEEDEVSSGSSSARPCTREDDDEQSLTDSASRGSLMSKSSTGIGNTCVQVALRIRPLLPREVIANAKECISVTPNEPQVWIAGTHAFTYDYVFKTDARQDEIFVAVAKPLVDGILEGYNATILAYGQTGSGKTFTMGTGFDPNVLTTQSENQGLLPRCITYLFDCIHNVTVKQSPPPDFKISVQFTELYNEEVIDLLSDAPSSRPGTARHQVKIHEQANGQIYLVNINTKPVVSANDTLETLKTGALNRTTASTNMNDQSSRSHAIFTIHVTQNRVTRDRSGASDIETLTGKFHFVDLAGSERLKRTMATGERAREGIAINSGLLALGNVISALGDKSKKSSHVPYRDSKLTRLLQDSLGGNSRTLMIACVSPNEIDFVETLNSLKYANRAKNIRNRVVVNQDKSSRTISLLKEEIARLNAELNEYKRGGKRLEDDEMGADVNAENIMLLAEVDTLKFKLKSKQDTIDKLTSQVARLQAVTVATEEGGAGECDLTNLISRYLQEIEGLRGQLYESETECEKLRAKQRVILKNLSSPRESGVGAGASPVASIIDTQSVGDLISKAKSELKVDRMKVGRREEEEKEEASDDEEDQEEEGSDEEEENRNIENYSQLADLTQEINTKQRLIEELENSQLRLESLKQKYEEKLSQLAQKIRCTEEERDAVMSKSTTSVDKSKEYETKIQNLQQELKRWNNAKREHAKLLKNQTQYESQIGKLRREIEDMKRMKVKLMNQVKNENVRHREVEKQRLKEITQLRKEARVKDIRVRKLESDQRLKEAVLKRKLEEVEMLKRGVRNAKGGGRGVGKGSSPVKGKQVWSRVQSVLLKDVSARGNVASLEREMMNLISRRTQLNEQLSGDLDLDSRDSIETNLRMIEEKIREVQEEIVCSNQLDGDNGDSNIRERGGRIDLSDCSTKHDYNYVFEKIYEQLVSSMTESSGLEGKVREVEAANRHLHQEVETLRSLLQFLYTRNPNVQPPPNYEPPQESSTMMPPPPPNPQSMTKARRRLTSTTQELLGSAESVESLCSNNGVDTNNPLNRTFTRNRLTQSLRGSKGGAAPQQRRKVPLMRQDTYSVIDRDLEMNRTFLLIEPNNQLTTLDDNNTNKVALQRSVSEIVDGGGGSGSERVGRSRGGGGSGGNGNVKSPRGNAWLQLTRTLEGHTKPILCLSSTESTLVSGSKDGSARVWDLETSKEISCFDGHPHNVSCVCHVPDLNLLLTGSSYQVRVFDLRSNEVVKVMSSSGTILPTTSSAPQTIPSLPTTTTLPRVNELPAGERTVYSIQRVRDYFYTSFGERIKIWDLRKHALIGTIPGKHNSSVMCITGEESGLHDNDWVITGSKDHSIKVYEYPVGTPPDQITSIRNLNPPHYDGIECLLMRNGALYSGSRDTCIKKWDLENFRMTSTVTNAHSGWITGLCGVPKGDYSTDSEFIVSCSRDGQLKLWDCGGKEFREVCRYEGSVGMDTVDSNGKFLFFGGGSGGSAGNSVSCCQINERLFNLIVQYREYQQQQQNTSNNLRDRTLGYSRIHVSPSSSPKFRRKMPSQVHYLTSSNAFGGSSDNIMSRSTGGADFLQF